MDRELSPEPSVFGRFGRDPTREHCLILTGRARAARQSLREEIAPAPIVRAVFDLPPARIALEDTEPAKGVRGMKAISLRINFSTSIVLRARHAT